MIMMMTMMTRRVVMAAGVLAMAVGLPRGASAEFKVYVAVDARAGGDGTEQSPYQTLTQTRDAIRQARMAGTLAGGEPVSVLIGPGVYRQEASFELTSQDSGSAEAPVVYRALERGTARIHGGITLPPHAFRPLADQRVLARLDPAVRDKVLVCDVSAAAGSGFADLKTAYQGVPAGPWLYVDGRPMTLARWPNVDGAEAGWASFSKATDTGLPQPNADDPALRQLHPGAFEFDDPRPARWKLDEGVWLLGYWTHDWCEEVLRVAAYDAEKKVIRLAAPHGSGINGGTWGAAKRRFFALNALEELDAPGEWYLDRKQARLYFYPVGPLAGTQVVLATLNQPLVKVQGAKHVKFVELVFEYAHADGVVLAKAEGVELAGCVVANCAGGGISIDGNGNTVRSCDLFHLGTFGIQLNGGDRKSLTPGANLAVNNHVHHYGIFQRTYAPGIGVQGCGQIVRNNCIHDAPHNAILYGGNEHLFELNEIYRVVMETGDAGAFYTGRDWTTQGNVLRHNFIHDLGGGDATHVNTMGIYLDDCDSGDTLEGNVFFRAGRAIMIGGGRDNPVLNNLVVDCPIGLHIDGRGMRWKQSIDPNDTSWGLEAKAKQLNYLEPPWSTRYPRLAAIMNESPREPLNNPVRSNVFVDCTKQVCEFDGDVRKLLDKLDIANNLAVNTTGVTAGMAKPVEFTGFTNLAGTEAESIDLGFVDRAAGNLALRPRSRLAEELPVFMKIPFDKIGLYQDEYRRQLPDWQIGGRARER